MSYFEIIAAKSVPGDGIVNEDLIGFTDRAAWVLDGATGVGETLLPASTDASWFVQQVDRRLRQALRSRPLAPTVDVLADAIADVGHDFAQAARRPPADLYELPSAAFTMIRFWEDRIELTGLGDCGTIVRQGEDMFWFGAGDVAPIEARTLEELFRLRREHPQLPPEAIKPLLLPYLRNARTLMNRPSGYWVLSPDFAGLDHLTSRVLPAQSFECALMSDGMSRLADLFLLCAHDDFLAIEDDADAEALLNRLREAECADAGCASFPRVKRHDDASLLRVRFRQS